MLPFPLSSPLSSPDALTHSSWGEALSQGQSSLQASASGYQAYLLLSKSSPVSHWTLGSPGGICTQSWCLILFSRCQMVSLRWVSIAVVTE